MNSLRALAFLAAMAPALAAAPSAAQTALPTAPAAAPADVGIPQGRDAVNAPAAAANRAEAAGPGLDPDGAAPRPPQRTISTGQGGVGIPVAPVAPGVAARQVDPEARDIVAQNAPVSDAATADASTPGGGAGDGAPADAAQGGAGEASQADASQGEASQGGATLQSSTGGPARWAGRSGAAAGPASGELPQPREAASEPAPAPAEITEEEVAEVMRVATASNPSTSAEAAEAARAALQDWDSVAARASQSITDGRASTPALEVLRETLSEQRLAARALADRSRAAADPYRAQLEALGPAPEEGAAEARETAVERRALNALVAAMESRARQADLAAARAESLTEDIDRLIRDRFADELQTRGPTPLAPDAWADAASALYEATAHLADEAATALTDPVAEAEREKSAPMFALAVAGALVLGVWLRRRMIDRLLAAAPEGAGRGRRVAVGAMIAAARLILPALALVIVVLGVRYASVLGYRGEQALDHLTEGLMVLIAGRGIAWAYYAPYAPRFRMSALDDTQAARASALAVGLALVYLADSALVGFGEQYGFAPGALSVLNLCILGVGAVMMWGLAAYVRPPRDEAEEKDRPDEDDIAAYQAPAEDDDAAGLGRRLLILGAFAMRAVALISLLLAAAGYFAASRYAFFPTTMTLGLLAAGVLLFTMIREGVEGYLTEVPAHGGATPDVGGGLRLIPIFAGLVIILALIPELALIWGARPSDLADGWQMISDGIVLGETRVSPIDFLTFVLVFLAVYTVMRLLQSVLRRSVLPNTRLDVGARNAISSFAGYAGFALAALAAISAAGLDLSSLAIVAGALSVGIGFGLQNVVNNFVSGIILLVERPIKVGDWILVNGTHGTVKKISVRATEIETFDRAAYIVPNGDLISSPVTNMTHGNNVGRLIVPVGVAYGTDVEKVRRILTETSTSHSAVLRYPAPQILFMEFGADSLNFEIRVILRDIGQVLDVRSHMHFEIDRRFRAAGIEIPFAQRDLHLRNPEDMGAAIGKAMAAAMAAPRTGAVEPRAIEPAPAMAPGEGRPDPAEPAPERRPKETDPRPADQRGEADADGAPDGGDPR